MKTTYMCMLACALTALAVPGMAQSSRISVKVPFAFTVGSTAMPAGDYSLEEDPTGVVFITCRELRRTMLVLTAADTPNDTFASAVKFEKVDGHYNLSEVVLAAEPSRRVLGSNKGK